MAELAWQFKRKIDFYIIYGDSARFESYRVMFDYILDGNLLGAGLGTFGGPSSITYYSPLYQEYNFFWFNAQSMNTTDTFYPHIFVELGLVFGLIYFIQYLSPLFFAIKNKKYVSECLLVLFFILFDSLFSFSLKNVTCLMCGPMLLFGLSEIEN